MGRRFDAIWELPTTSVGWLAVALAGPQVRVVRLADDVSPGGRTTRLVTGPGVGRLFDRIGHTGVIGAMALGRVVLARDDEQAQRLLDHELVHVRQAWALGPFFLPAYLGASLWARLRGRDAYLDNVFEVEARRYAA